jgi:hypothetical protein
LCRWSKSWFYLNSGSNPVREVMQETDKMPVERTDDFIGFIITGE